MKKQMEEANEAARQRDIAAFLDQLDSNVANPIAAFIEDLQWFQAGGWRINAAFEALKQGLQAGTISPQEAEQWASQLYVATEDLQVDLNNITADQAAQNLSSTLGMSLDDAKATITGTDGIDAALARISNTEWVINLRWNYSGTPPPGWGGGSSQPKTKPDHKGVDQEFASGGTPSAGGYYWVGEQGPEPFFPAVDGRILSVQQSQDAMRGGGGIGNVNQQFYFYGPANPQQVMQAAEVGVRRLAIAKGKL